MELTTQNFVSSGLRSQRSHIVEKFCVLITDFSFTVYVTASGETPLFCDDESRASDPGNRCKLRLRHALLMALVRKKDNPTQGTLQAIFGVDQTSVCRYLKVMDKILAAVLPTAKNISKEIAECKTVEGFKKRVPGPDGGRYHRGRYPLSRAAPVREEPQAHEILGKEEAVHQQHQHLHQRRRGDNRDVEKLRGIHRRHHAAQGGSDAVWQVGRIHA